MVYTHSDDIIVNSVLAASFNPVFAALFNPVLTDSFNLVLAASFNPVLTAADAVEKCVCCVHHIPLHTTSIKNIVSITKTPQLATVGVVREDHMLQEGEGLVAIAIVRAIGDAKLLQVVCFIEEQLG